MSKFNQLCRSVARTLVAVTAIPLLLSPIVVSATNLVNVSTRGEVGTGDKRMIVGFVTEGEERLFVVFALGPSLQASGVEDTLADPKLVLLVTETGKVLAQNDNWEDDPNSDLIAQYMESIGKTLNDLDAALVIDLEEGSYSVLVEGADGGTGVALAGAAEIDGDAITITPGKWQGELGGVCLNVAPDGTTLTTQNSECFLQASLRNVINVNFCDVTVTTVDTIPIVNNTFTFTQSAGLNTTTITGTFVSASFVMGTAMVTAGLNTCIADWSATPAQ